MKKLSVLIVSFFLTTFILFAGLNKNEKVQRTVNGVFDCQKNTLSNFQFPVANNGIIFMEIPFNKGGGYWPRGSLNQYIFGGGVWFGAKKWIPADSFDTEGNNVSYRELQKLVEITYNPNSGISWMVPGRIEDGDLLDTNDFKKYRVYFSTDMDSDGKPINTNDGQNWPVWLTEDNTLLKTGMFINNTDDRSRDVYQKGPAFISDEDIFSTYKDSDLNYYEGGVQMRRNIGYPLRLQFEQTIFSCGNDNNMIIILYKAINKSTDTLFDCWFAPVYDVDIAKAPNTQAGAVNDRGRYFSEDPNLNMGIAWTDTNRGEAGENFGYIGVSLVLTPATDANSFLKPTEDLKNREKQIGLRTYRNWPIMEDIVENEARYNYVISGEKDGDIGSGDCRMLLATGPFNLLQGDTAYFAVQINFAAPALGGEATGNPDDTELLKQKVAEGQTWFYSNILTEILEQNIKPAIDYDIFPNPASEKVLIKHNFSGNTDLRIYDILGQLIIKQNKINLSANTFEIDVSNFPSGNYIICLINNNAVISKSICVIK